MTDNPLLDLVGKQVGYYLSEERGGGLITSGTVVAVFPNGNIAVKKPPGILTNSETVIWRKGGSWVVLEA